MALDFGGLDYTITVRDQFSSNVEAFRAGIQGARADFAKLRRELGAPVRSTGQRELARATRETTKALTEEQKAVRASRRERRDAVRVLSLSRASKVLLGRATRKLAIAQAAANLEVRRNLVNSRQQLAADQLRVRAERDLSKVIDARGRSEQVLAAARERGITLTTEELRKLKLLTVEQEKLFLAKKKLAEQEAIAGNTELRRITAETAAIKLQNIELQKAANLRAIQARRPIGGGGRIPQAQFVTQATPVVSPGTESATFRDRIRNFLRLNEAQTKAAASANRFSFTFRRLIGILAAFTVVRLIVRGFTDLVRQLVLFNANIEQATLGIASLFTAVGDVRDATGQAASASQSLAIAQGEARRQTQLLRRDALETAATFDKLLETFQVAVAPGLAAGLDLDEIREFTVRISQAASAIGLQQNQLAEEIRSILAGTIQARTTRIAVALGITNEDIRLAKEAGVLTQFLNERFEAFKQSGIEALGTFNALLTNTRDAILLLFEEGGLEFFEELKGLLADIQALIRTTDVEGTLVPNPAAVGIIRAIADGLRSAAAAIRSLVSEESLGGLEGLAQIIGQTIGLVATVLTPIVAGILSGLNDIKTAFLAVRDVVAETGIAEVFSGEIISDVVKQLTRIVSVIGIIAVTTLAWAGTLVILKGTLILIVGLLTSTSGLLGLGVAAVAFLVIGVKKLVEGFVEVQLSLLSLIKVLARAFVNGLKIIGLVIRKFFIDVFEALKLGARATITLLAQGILGAIKAVFKLLATVSKTAQKVVDGIAKTQKNITDNLRREIRLAKTRLAQRSKELELAKRRLRTEVAALAQQEAQDRLAEAFDLAAVLATIPGIIARGRQPLEAQGKLIKELTEDAKKAADALRFSGETIDLGGTNVLALRKIEFEALIQLREKGLFLTKQQDEAEQKITEIQLARIRNEKLLNTLSDRNRQSVEEAADLSQDLVQARTDLANAESQVTLERLRLRTATGDEAKAAFERLVTAETLEDTLKNQVTQLERTLQNVSDVLGVSLKTKEEQEKVVKIIKDRILLNGRELIQNEQIRDIAADRLQLARLINRAANDRIRLTAQVAAQELSEEVLLSRIELETERQLLAATGLNTFAQEAIAIEGAIRLAEKELEIAEDRALARQQELQDQIDRAQLQQESFIVANFDLTRQEQIAKAIELQLAAQKRLDAAKKAGDTDAAAAAQIELDRTNDLLSTLRAIEALEIVLKLTDEADVERLKRLNLELDKLQEKADALANLKVDAFGKQLGDAINTATQSLKTFGIQAIGEFSAFASNAIVDAFDPTKDVDLKQRFASFLQSIARQVLELTIRIAILRAFGGVGGAATGGQIAAARPIPRFRAKGGPVGPFSTARGFEGGGVPNKPAPASIRPPNLPPTDKVPIWTTAGEWVIKRASAAKYGNAVMSAINRGLINPTALRSLAGISRRHSIRSARGPGFQEGGLVSETLAAQAEAQERVADEETTGPQILPVMVADRQTMQRLVDAGGEVLLDFLRENQDQINTQDLTRT